MKFTVRKAEVQDAAAIAHVQIESWKTTYAGIVPDSYLASLTEEDRTQRWQELLIAGKAAIFVAEDEAEIFGFSSGGEIREKIDGYDAELYAIYLLQQRQKQGAGRELCMALTFDLIARGFSSMMAWVLEQNSSISFYKRLGAVEVASKFVEIGGVSLPELAFGWPSLSSLTSSGVFSQR
jgi:ribosomal protein S18 acetylase RimI-like enzyme